MFFPTFFNLSPNLVIRSSWSEPQSAPSLVFADCIELVHCWLAFAPTRHLILAPQGALSDLWGLHCFPRHSAQYRRCPSALDWELEGTGRRCWDPLLGGPGVLPCVSASLSVRNSIWFKDRWASGNSTPLGRQCAVTHWIRILQTQRKPSRLRSRKAPKCLDAMKVPADNLNQDLF